MQLPAFTEDQIATAFSYSIVYIDIFSKYLNIIQNIKRFFVLPSPTNYEESSFVPLDLID